MPMTPIPARRTPQEIWEGLTPAQRRDLLSLPGSARTSKGLRKAGLISYTGYRDGSCRAMGVDLWETTPDGAAVAEYGRAQS